MTFSYIKYYTRMIIAIIIILAVSDIQFNVASALPTSFYALFTVGTALLFYGVFIRITKKIFVRNSAQWQVEGDNIIIKIGRTCHNIELKSIKNVMFMKRSFFGESYVIFLCKTQMKHKVKIISPIENQEDLFNHPLGKLVNYIQRNSRLTLVPYANDTYIEYTT